MKWNLLLLKMWLKIKKFTNICLLVKLKGNTSTSKQMLRHTNNNHFKKFSFTFKQIFMNPCDWITNWLTDRQNAALVKLFFVWLALMEWAEFFLLVHRNFVFLFYIFLRLLLLLFKLIEKTVKNIFSLIKLKSKLNTYIQN